MADRFERRRDAPPSPEIWALLIERWAGELGARLALHVGGEFDRQLTDAVDAVTHALADQNDRLGAQLAAAAELLTALDRRQTQLQTSLDAASAHFATSAEQAGQRIDAAIAARAEQLARLAASQDERDARRQRRAPGAADARLANARGRARALRERLATQRAETERARQTSRDLLTGAPWRARFFGRDEFGATIGSFLAALAASQDETLALAAELIALLAPAPDEDADA